MLDHLLFWFFFLLLFSCGRNGSKIWDNLLCVLCLTGSRFSTANTKQALKKCPYFPQKLILWFSCVLSFSAINEISWDFGNLGKIQGGDSQEGRRSSLWGIMDPRLLSHQCILYGLTSSILYLFSNQKEKGGGACSLDKYFLNSIEMKHLRNEQRLVLSI